MAYQAEISRKNPTAFVFLIDQSGSMGGESGKNDDNGDPYTKAQAVANSINELLKELINKCQKGEGFFDFFDIAMIGYGQKSTEAYFAWEDPLKGETWCKISQIKDNPADEVTIKKEVNVRGVLHMEEHTETIWIKPVARGTTPMKAALIETKDLLVDWIKDHDESYPPIVINITDAAATDISNKQELIDVANEIKAIKNTDGNVLFINCHIESGKGSPVIFPASKEELPNDQNAYMLYEMSSDLPDQYINPIVEVFAKNALTYKNARGMAYNSNITGLISLLDIGTRATKNAKP